MMHELKMDVKRSDITKAGVAFTIYDEAGKKGTLKVSLGSLTWYSGHKTKNNKSVISWEAFDKFMMQRRSK